MFLVTSVTSVIGMKYLYVDRAKNFFSKMLRFRHQGYQMKALEKVDEECHTFRALATSLNNGNSISKMDFERILGKKAVKR